jgi:hypothetical protein
VSNPSHRRVDRDDPTFFAPQRIQECVQAASWDKGSKGFDKWRENSTSQAEPPIKRMLRSCESTQPLQLTAALRSSSGVRMLLRPFLAAAVTAGLAFPVVGSPREMGTSGANKRSTEPNLFWSLFLTQAKAQSANRESAKLVITPASPQRMGEAVPLGVSVLNSGFVDIVSVRGLGRGTTLSAGHRMGPNNWFLFATDVQDVMIQPPPQFVGVMDITVELRVADTAVDSQMLRFEWTGPEPQETESVNARVPGADLQSKAIHKLTSEEFATLLKRGNDLIASGDLAAARLVLRRVAEAGDAGGALALARTYDPITLEKLQVHGLSPDLAMARHWYEKAKDLGSQDALRRLEILASRPD